MQDSFDIVKPVSSYVTSSLYEGYGPVQIAEQPSMFDFTINMGTQLGQVTAFVAGVVLFNASEHLAAEPLFTTAIAVVDQPLAEEFSRALHYYRGANYWYLGRFLEAQPDLDLLKPQQDLTADRVDELDLSILNILGLVYDDLGEKRQALEYYNQALPIRRTVGDKGGEATTLNNIGSVYDALGEKQQALDYYNQALPIYRAVGDKSREAVILTGIGAIYYSQNGIEEALKTMNAALEIQLEIGAIWEAVISYWWIGVIHQQLDDLDAAAESIESAITLATERNHPALPQLQALLVEINAQRRSSK